MGKSLKNKRFRTLDHEVLINSNNKTTTAHLQLLSRTLTHIHSTNELEMFFFFRLHFVAEIWNALIITFKKRNDVQTEERSNTVANVLTKQNEKSALVRDENHSRPMSSTHMYDNLKLFLFVIDFTEKSASNQIVK